MSNILNNINLTAKFAILGLFCLVLFSVPTVLFVSEGNNIFRTSRKK